MKYLEKRSKSRNIQPRDKKHLAAICPHCFEPYFDILFLFLFYIQWAILLKHNYLNVRFVWVFTYTSYFHQ